MDAQEARESLEAIQTRQRQVTDTATRYGFPWWYVGGIGVLWLVATASRDLRDLMEAGVARQLVYYAIPLVALGSLWLLARRLHRELGFRGQRPAARTNRYLLAVTIAVLIVYIALGTVLRQYDVPWDHTVSGAAAALVLIVGCRATWRLAPEPETVRC